MMVQTGMLQCVYAIKSHLKLIKNIYILVNIEFVFNFKKAERFNDLISVSPGIGYVLNDDWKLKIYTSYGNTQNTTENTSTSNDFVLRLRVNNTIKLKQIEKISTKIN